MAGQDVSIEELERIAALGWQATTTRPLGDWLLRAADGFTGRANSVLPLGSPGLPLPDAVATATGFYRKHALRPRFQVPLDAPGTALAALDAALVQRGWSAVDPADVMIADIGAVLDTCARRPDLPTAELAAHPGTEWIEGYVYRGRPLPASAIALLTNAADPVFALVRRGDVRLGVARGTVDAGWLGVTAVTVDPTHRRNGIGTHLLVELARWAAGRGAERIYLQVAAENTGAIELYRRAGFTVHHRYHYRVAPEGG